MVPFSAKIPTLVQHIEVDGKPFFNLRPLFLNYPAITNRRYQDAVNQYRKLIRQELKFFSLERKSAPDLLWYLFAPPGLQFLKKELDCKIGGEFIKGLFGVVRFEVNNLPIAFFPNAGNYMAMLPAEVAGSREAEQAFFEKVWQKWLQQELETQGADFSSHNYQSHRRDFLTEIDFRMELKYVPDRYHQIPDAFRFFRIQPHYEFDGSTELYKVGQDLNEAYPQELQRAYYREDLVEPVMQMIYQKENIPLAIVGPEGVGRHSLVHEAVFRYLTIYRQQIKDPFSAAVWRLDPTRVIAGMSVVGMWQKRLEAILGYLRQPRSQYDLSHKLLIDNPVALLRIGKSAQNDMAFSDVLKPYLEKRLLQVILIATPEEWAIVQEKDRSFSDLFQVMRVTPPDMETAVRMILAQRKHLEKDQQVRITSSAIGQLLFVYRNYLNNKALPGGVIRLMRQLAAKYRYGRIDAPEVREEFSLSTGLKEQIFDPAHVFEPDEVQLAIGRELIGQEEAVHALANVVNLFKAKLNNKSRPVSSLMFIGPTGVGKTQAAKILAKYLMGSEEALLRFDMNEYIDAGAVHRLIGDYYQPEGQLTGKVRYRPFSVVLLDEIEKAHFQVLDLLLQLLDDGRLTDSIGRTVDFTNCIIVMTSNAGADAISGKIGFGRNPQDEAAIYRRALENNFRPEFLNRIDKLVVFRNLGLDHFLDIARLQIKELLQREGFIRRTTILNIDKEALNWVARRSFDARMGGRALRRQIEQDLTTLTAEQLLRYDHHLPIIMDIHLENDQLQSDIRPLTFVDPLPGSVIPAVPDEKGGTSFYRRLLRAVERLVAEVRQKEDKEYHTLRNYQDDWRYYEFKERMSVVLDRIRTIQIGHNDPNFIKVFGAPYRLKRSNLASKKHYGEPLSKAELEAQLFDELAIQELSDYYQFAGNLFDHLKTEFLDYFLDVAFLLVQGHDFLTDKFENLELRLESLVPSQGLAEVEFLAQRYLGLFDELDIAYKYDPTRHSIGVEGYAISDLMAGETGIHLFFAPHRSPLPVRLRIHRQDQKQPDGTLQVIRLYDGQKTLTDLRTGLSNAANITPAELKLLIYAGFAPEIRDRIQL